MQVDNLILTKSLGKGSFGEVFLTQKKGSKELYATKRLDRAFSEKPENMKRLKNEISLLKGIIHPNIVRLFDLKKTKTHVYIVTQYCNGGSLTDCLQSYINSHFRPFPEEIVQYLMKQIVNALKFLHANKVIHRDLKLDNILVNFPNDEDKKSLNMMKATVKLIDFGFATKLQSSKANLTHTVLGTPSNMEPQLLKNMENKTRNKEGYDEKVDIWSLGTLCYQLLVGHNTFSGINMEDLFKRVKEGNYTLPINTSKEAASFITGMLQYEPKNRLSADELYKHDFLVKKVKDFTPIDRSKIENKISGNTININIKDNKTICDAFNQGKKFNNNNINNININYNDNQNNYNFNYNQNLGIPIQQQNPNSVYQQKDNKPKYAKVTNLPGLKISQYQMAPENIIYGQQQQLMYPITEIPEVNQDIWQDPFMTNQVVPSQNINQINFDNQINNYENQINYENYY